MTAGVLVVDKPQGLTSHDVVAAVRRLMRERRIGHCGTLDPLATGVLALAIGPATRLVQFLSSATKHYEAVVRFGAESDTYDAAGTVRQSGGALPSLGSLEAALAQFRGTFAQTPPAFSAKKVAGVRAYSLARKGLMGSGVASCTESGLAGSGVARCSAAELAPVSVTCERLVLESFDGERARLSLAVSAGFYVRSLAHDLGRALGTGALLEALRRTRSGDFSIEQAVAWPVLVEDPPERLAERLVPLSALLPGVPVASLSLEDVVRVGHGADVPLPAGWTAAPPLTRLLTPTGQLLALAVPAKRAGLLHPSVVLG